MSKVDASKGLVIWVDFEVHPEHMERFETLLLVNARTSLDVEPGCRQFDVLASLPARSAFSLYEVYDNEAAFQSHLASPHYLEFVAAAAPAVKNKVVKTFLVKTL